MDSIVWLVMMIHVTYLADPLTVFQKETGSDLSISLEQPTRDFQVGEPITLTVTFSNNRDHDVTITSFCPETSPSEWLSLTCQRFVDGSRRTLRVFDTRTDVDIVRLSGIPRKAHAVPGVGVYKNREFSFLVKAGMSASQSFDLMQTRPGAQTINSSGRFKVSLLFGTRERQAKRSEEHNGHDPPQREEHLPQWKELSQRRKGPVAEENADLPQRKEDPLAWEGEVRAAPIEITVVEKKDE